MATAGQALANVREQSLQKAVADRALLDQRIQAALTRDYQRRALGYQAYTSPSPTDQAASALSGAATKGQSYRAQAGSTTTGLLDQYKTPPPTG
jgi:hypothetical protein